MRKVAHPSSIVLSEGVAQIKGVPSSLKVWTKGLLSLSQDLDHSVPFLDYSSFQIWLS